MEGRTTSALRAQPPESRRSWCGALFLNRVSASRKARDVDDAFRAEEQFLYANHDNDFPYRKELEALRTRHPEFRIDYVVSPNRIDEKSIPQLVPDIEKPMLYVSGPEPMVQSMDETLKKIGVPEERIKNDFFPGYEWP